MKNQVLNRRSWLRPLLILCGLLAGFSLASAQDEGERSKEATRNIRFLPVGMSPIFRQEIRDGVRYELEPPEGSVPPLKITLEAFDAEEKPVTVKLTSSQEEGVMLRLNAISAPVKVATDATALKMLDEGPWAAVKLPLEKDVLVVLWRDRQEGTWARARSLVVEEDPQSYGEGQLRVINISPAKLKLAIAGQGGLQLSPGEVKFHKVGITEGTPVALQYQDPRKGWQRLWSNAVTLPRGRRGTLLIYYADGDKPRKPIEVFFLRELVVRPTE